MQARKVMSENVPPGAEQREPRLAAVSSRSHIAFPLVLLAYLAASVGSLGLPFPQLENIIITATLALSAALLVYTYPYAFRARDWAILLLISLYFILQSARALDLHLASRKLDGILISSLLCFTIFRIAWRILGREAFLRLFCHAALLILFLTLLYKIYFGFGDRSVRFFLNGPIIFGWMMGISAVFSICYALSYGQKTYYLICVAFLIALIWTGSKGPIVATTAAVFYVIASSREWGRGALTLGLGLTAAYIANEVGILPERLLTLWQLLNPGQYTTTEYGSVGIRQHMWEDSWGVFLSQPAFGVGLGNWPAYAGVYYVNLGMIYPHNLIAELLSEHGVVGLIFVTALLAAILKRTSWLGRTVAIFSVVALMFTGDAEYWRFLVAIPLALDDQ